MTEFDYQKLPDNYRELSVAALSAPVVEPVGHFIKHSGFGPWIEVAHPQPGSQPLYASPTAPQTLQADSFHVAGSTESADTRLEAARWQALLSSGRIRILGSAGFTGETDYRHVGMEIWTRYTAPQGREIEMKISNEAARKILTEYADAIIAAQSGTDPGQDGRPNKKDSGL
jgi:hypothetical protein